MVEPDALGACPIPTDLEEIAPARAAVDLHGIGSIRLPLRASAVRALFRTVADVSQAGH